ncbi:hypothetical protein ACFYNO_36125 [Kitasatospora sp. NPDC006697]|uniref:hypothetical protein n=1 Tax=Kitasatospora sp. NPDC006697 TaxID=3364020 RepID=UPI00369EC05C
MLWQRANVLLVAELAGTERDGKTRAAEALGITDTRLGRLLREHRQRREGGISWRGHTALGGAGD